jgi:hypothetical protein
MDEALVGVGSRQSACPLNGGSWVSFTTLRLILKALGRSAPARKARLAVSDRGTLGGLTQFITQFGFAGSTISL